MKKLMLSLFVLVGLAFSAFAQERIITGTVTSEDNQPIQGVNVRVTGTATGTTTDPNGKFSLRVGQSATSLTFTFIGMIEQAKAIGSGNVVNAVLLPSSEAVEEVVVTGVGVATSKKLVPIEVTTLSSKDFPKSATTNINQALQGQIAGAQIIQRSGTPGAGAQIILRGFTNLSGTTPLIMIDGVQIQSDLLTDLDPNIVERIEVVKGAAGGMLYGAQGGNGVIQIFTKRGANNSKLSIDFSSKYSSDRVIELNDLIATRHHWVTDASNNILGTNNQPIQRSAIGVWPNPNAMPFGTDKTVKNDKTFNLPLFDHMDQANRVASTYVNSLNIRGGAEKYDFSFGASHLSQEDVFSDKLSRTNMNLNIGFNPLKGLNFRSSTQLISTYENLLGGNRFNLINSLQWVDFKYRDPNTGLLVVKPSQLTDNNNSLSEREARERFSKTPRIVQNFSLNYKFPKFLELDAKYAIDGRAYESRDFTYNQMNRTQTQFWGTRDGSISRSFQNYRVYYGNGSAFLRTDFKEDFKMDLPIKTTTQFSYDFRKVMSESFSASGVGLPEYPPYTLSSGATRTGSDSSSESLIYGFLVNQTFEYGNLFGISAGFRSDYSSAFGGQGTAATFPRGTVFINPSEFFKNRNLVTNWKIRAAYGEAGVQPGIYDRQVTFGRGGFGESGSYLVSRTTANNPDLRIQTTTEMEVGTDLNLTPSKGNWASNLSFNATYWKRTSDDVLQLAPVAPSTGSNNKIDNLVALEASGLDLSLDMNAYRSTNLNWNVGLRWAKAKSSVTKVSNNVPITVGAFNLAPGGDLGNLYMQSPLTSLDQLRPDGTRYIPSANVGNFEMVNGYVVNKANYNVVVTGSDDLSVVGNVNPDFTASFINTFTIFKKLTITAQLDWTKGADIYNQTKQWLYRDRLSIDFDKPVTIEGQSGAFVAYYNSLYNTNTPLSHFIENGSYVRLRDISVSYNLTDLIKQKWAKNVSLSASGRNLFTWTNYTGLDPETNAAVTNQGGTVSGVGSFRGVDYYTAPNVKSIQFSLNIGL